jgi:1-acyl-sn-glycerol-3-phosphate acyltransferase
MSKSVPGRKAPVFHAVKLIAKIFLSQVFKIRANGQENLPAKTAFILLPKHQRWEDIPLLSVGTPRPLHYMAKYELFSNPVSRWFLSSLGGIPLDRSRPLESRQSLKTMLDLLEKDEGIVIFPGGTYYRNKI